MSKTLHNNINLVQEKSSLQKENSSNFHLLIRKKLYTKIKRTKAKKPSIYNRNNKYNLKKQQLSFCTRNRLKKILVSKKRFFVKKRAAINVKIRPFFFRGDFPYKSRNAKYKKSRKRVFTSIKARKLSMPEKIGIVRIHSVKNNTRVSLIDKFGNVKATISAGSLEGKKSSPYTAFAAGEFLAKKAHLYNYSSFIVQLKGLGFGRESAVRGLKSKGLQIHRLEDVNRFPHNGCRPPKRRRVR